MPIRVSTIVPAPAQLIAAALVLSALAAGCRQPEAASSGAPTAAACLAPAAASTAAPTAAVAPGQVPAAIATILEEIKRGDTNQLAVSPEDGQFLRMLVASTGRKRALEIGAAQGYSAIWIGMGLRDTGGTARHDRVRPGSRQGSGGEREAGRARRHRDGDRRRRVRRDSQADRHLRLRLRRRLEARLHQVLRPHLPAPRRRRALPRSQRDQQEERDERLPRSHRHAPRSLHVDRRARRRRGVDLLQAPHADHEPARHRRRSARPRRRPPRRRHGTVRGADRRHRRAPGRARPRGPRLRRRRHADCRRRRRQAIRGSAISARSRASARRSTIDRATCCSKAAPRSCSAAITASAPDRWRPRPASRGATGVRSASSGSTRTAT